MKLAIILLALTALPLALCTLEVEELNKMLLTFRPESLAASPGWNEDDFVYPTGSRWVIVGDVKPDWYLNVMVNVKRVDLNKFKDICEVALHDLLGLEDPDDMETSEEFPKYYQATLKDTETKVYYSDAPLKDLIKQMASSPKVKKEALEKQKKVHEKSKIWRICPHSYIVNIADFGQFGQRNLYGRDVAELIPDDWQFDPVRDEHSNSLQVICNRAGNKFTYMPGAQINVGTTAWIYDRNANKILQFGEIHFDKDPHDETKLRRDEGRLLGMPCGNIDLAKDMRPISEHPFADLIEERKFKQMGGKYLDLVYGAIREFAEETGLYRPEVQQKLPTEAQQALWNMLKRKDVRLVQYIEWQANQLAPSINFNFLFNADGMSKLPAEYLMGDLSEGVKTIQWVEPTKEQLWFIEHALNVQHKTFESGKGHTLITSAKFQDETQVILPALPNTS